MLTYFKDPTLVTKSFPTAKRASQTISPIVQETRSTERPTVPLSTDILTRSMSPLSQTAAERDIQRQSGQPFSDIPKESSIALRKVHCSPFNKSSWHDSTTSAESRSSPLRQSSTPPFHASNRPSPDDDSYERSSRQRGNGEISDSEPRTFLWSGTRRRQRGFSSEAHTEMMRVMKRMFNAIIFSGAAGCGAWPEENPVALERIMRDTWSRVKMELGPSLGYGNNEIASVPTDGEAREVSLFSTKLKETLRADTYTVI